MMPEQRIIVDEFTYVMLGLMARDLRTTIGDAVELLVLEQMVRQALREEAATVPISAELWEKIRARLKRS